MQATSETVSRQSELRERKHTSPTRFARGTWHQPKIALAERVTMVFRRKALHQALADISAPKDEAFDVAYDRAVAAHLAGEHDEALELFLSCQKLSPDNPTLAHNIARLQAIAVPKKVAKPIPIRVAAAAPEPAKEPTELAIIEVTPEPAEPTTQEPIEHELQPAQPDMIFSRDASPLIDIMTEKAPVATPRRRLTSGDLWTIILGTLALSMGAQYFLGGLGLMNL